MYDDELRAREQLGEIQEFLKACKDKIKTYKLPVISDNYYVQLNEANEAILEVIKEFEKKPIVIKTLNTRVDTARDLVLKLYNTMTNMLKDAQLSEMIIVYANRYRKDIPEVDEGLNDAELSFYKGNYKESFSIASKVISLIDENTYKKLVDMYEK